MFGIGISSMLVWVGRLEERAWYRMVLGLSVAALAALMFYRDVLVLLPHPALGFKLLRLMSLALVAYLAITWMVDLVYLYLKGLAFCRSLADSHAWTARLPEIYRHFIICSLKSVVKACGWKQVLLAGFFAGVLVCGLLMQSLAMRILE